jgi:CheY-like chemotaxis protein
MVRLIKAILYSEPHSLFTHFVFQHIYFHSFSFYRYDTVFEDDLPGFVAVKTQFWDNGVPNIECFIRRRTIEGEWIWLVTKVVSYIENPVRGVIIQENEIEEENIDHAIQMNRIIRITAILIQAVQSAKREQEKMMAVANVTSSWKQNAEGDNNHGTFSGHQIPLVAEDALAFRNWFQQAAGQTGMGISVAADSLQSIMMAALGEAPSGKQAQTRDANDPIAALERELMNGDQSDERKGFDPLSALKEVRGNGVRLDLGMVSLSLDELSMVTLVLNGKIRVEELASLVHLALTTPGMSLTSLLNRFSIQRVEEEEQQNPLQNSTPLSQGGRQHHTSHRFRKKSKPGVSLPLTPPFGELDRHTHEPSRLSLDHTKSNSHGNAQKFRPVFITVVNLSYTNMGNECMEIFGEFLSMEDSVLETLDVSFCALDEKGILSLARSLNKRKRRKIAPLRGLVLSGNHINYKAAKDLGIALSPGSFDNTKSRKRGKMYSRRGSTGYDEDLEDSDEEDLDDDDDFVGKSGRKRQARNNKLNCDQDSICVMGHGLQVLHLGSCSLTPEALYQLLLGLGPHCPVKELSIASNSIGPCGASLLVQFLEGKGKVNLPVLPFLDRLDLSSNDLGNDGTARLTRAVAKRVKNPFVDLRLSGNNIGHGGVETIMNKLLQHSIVSLSLDNNSISDQGCQLVAASLQSMHSLSRLNLAFNQIGSRGITTLMKSLISCESITYLGLSGNIMKISGAIAMGFTLAQHPRLEELDLDNCCLSQAAQCHIVAGIISNRWVPLKCMMGFQAGPPMVAINAIGVFAHNLSNEECFRIKRDEQMKNILQWMESNRAARENPRAFANKYHDIASEASQPQYLTPHFVSAMNEVHGTPSQNAYLRMLGWLSKIPFDEDELTTLRQYFYDIDGGDGDRGSDGYINLKLRGDLLAALDSGEADEIRDHVVDMRGIYKGSVGLDLDELENMPKTTPWNAMLGTTMDKAPLNEAPDFSEAEECRNSPSDESESQSCDVPRNVNMHIPETVKLRSSLSSLSRQSMTMRSGSDRSIRSTSSTMTERRARARARITMFPAFEQKLEELKLTAKEMVEQEPDPNQQDIILTHYAEASLTILRQLRYHCMNSGLDGWRLSGLRRKVLIVDDSLVTRKMVARAFEKANFIVDTAENGVEGVKKMKASIYDIAFMDIDMPIMNGFEATKALRQWEDTQRPGARQPICALTAAYVDDFERSELMKFKEAGLDVMESKPCNIPRLFKVVDDVSPMFSDLSISVSQGSFNSF